MLAVICSYQEEVEDLISQTRAKELKKISGIRLFVSAVNNNQLLIACAGSGQINAAYACGLIMSLYPVKGFIATGVCGAFYQSGIEIGDSIISMRIINPHFGLAFDEEIKDINPDIIYNNVSDTPKIIPSNSEWTNKLSLVSTQFQFQLPPNFQRKGVPRAYFGTILSSSIISASDFYSSNIFKRYSPLAEDTNSYAIASIAFKEKAPFVSIRVAAYHNNIKSIENTKNHIKTLSTYNSNIIARFIEYL